MPPGALPRLARSTKEPWRCARNKRVRTPWLLLPLLNNLALLYRETADYGRALRFAERARSIAELHNAVETTDGAAAFANLGAIQQMQGRSGGGQEIAEPRALDPREPACAIRSADRGNVERSGAGGSRREPFQNRRGTVSPGTGGASGGAAAMPTARLNSPC